MAMHAGMGLSKALLLIGAGFTGSILVRNGKLSDLLAELQDKMSNVFGRAKKILARRRESLGSSSQQPHAETPDEDAPAYQGEDVPHDPPQQHHQEDGVYLIDSEGTIIRRRGKATCETLRDLPIGTRIMIEVNDEGVPCNYPETNLLASYLGMIVKDSILASISFKDWRNPGMQSYKNQMDAEVEAKFAYPLQIRPWIRNSMGIKWRNYKTGLKNAYFDDRPIQEIIDCVPDGVDPLQWATLVGQWNEPRDKERAALNAQNARKQKCPHTMGRTSSVRRQQETMTQDRLQLWRLNRLHKDGSWASEDARERWDLACKKLAVEDLTPEAGNIEANERVFREIMGPEHPGRVRCKGIGVTPSKFYPMSSTSTTSYSSTGTSRQVKSEERLTKLEGDMSEVKGMVSKMFEFMKKQVAKKKKKQTTAQDDEDDDDDE